MGGEVGGTSVVSGVGTKFGHGFGALETTGPIERFSLGSDLFLHVAGEESRRANQWI
jgi:hypothetical protein